MCSTTRASLSLEEKPALGFVAGWAGNFGSHAGEFHAATREVEFKKKSMHEREIEMRKGSEAVSTSGPELGERDGAIQTR